MRGGFVVVIVGITALWAYSIGRQNAPVSKPQPTAIQAPLPDLAKPVGFISPTGQLTPPNPPIGPPPVTKTNLPTTAPTGPQTSSPDAKRKIETALTAAAIAAIIVKASRDQYYATGHPCACPDDKARNGSSCGARSAYSRPGGASPLCYPSDVTAAMIEAYRKTATASR
jgi:hypothetical protein